MFNKQETGNNSMSIILSQSNEKIYKEESTKTMNYLIKHITITPEEVVKYMKLDNESLQIKVYSDRNFCRNDDRSSKV